MKNKGNGKGKSERYVSLRYWLLSAPAWKSLPGNARALYIELAQRYSGSNNGRISFSVREAMQALGVSRGQAKYLFDMLVDRGFVVCTSKGAFSLKTERDATEWRITEYLRITRLRTPPRTSCAGMAISSRCLNSESAKASAVPR